MRTDDPNLRPTLEKFHRDYFSHQNLKFLILLALWFLSIALFGPPLFRISRSLDSIASRPTATGSDVRVPNEHP